MPYTKGASNAVGPYTTGGTGTAQQANNWETQYDEATQSFERDLFTPFVFSGLTAVKDGTTATQLDVAAGIAFPRQTDNTLRRQAPGSSTQSTVGHPSTTMYLFLNPDGTFAWQTSSTPPTNALAICHVTTDGSSNILTVVDDRVTSTSFMGSMVGTMAIPNAGKITFDLPLGSANQLMDWQQNFGVFSDNAGGTFGGTTSRLWISTDNTNGTQEVHIGPRGGSTFRLGGFRVLTNNVIFDGSAAGVFKIQGSMTFSADAGKITTDGSGNITFSNKATYNKTLGGANQTLIGLLPSDGTKDWHINYNTDGTISFHNATDNKIALKLLTSGGVALDAGNITTDGSGNISGPIGGGIPTTRNGAALSVPIYTGSSTPVNPPTGSLWFSA